MKKFTFVLMMMLAYAGFTVAQTIENFESIKMDVFAGGSTGATSVVANPDSSIANPSLYCGKMVRAQDGAVYQGWSHDFVPAITIAGNKYLHLKLWKTRITKIVVKYEKTNGVGNESGDVIPTVAQTKISGWEDFVFDISAYTGTEINRFTLIPDFPDPVGLTSDINIYFDDIYLNNVPTIGSAPVIVLENYEVMPFNMLLNDPLTDKSTMTLFPNPDKSGINVSDYVCKFNRDKDGQEWGGFWSPTSIDLTTNKFVHVKVWKPRITPLVFHLEGGSAGNGEFPSANTQTEINGWQDMVWDFRGKTGVFTVIGLQPDRINPVNLDNDITIYWDDLEVNNDSTSKAYLTLNVDMHGSGLTVGQKVYVAGTFPGWVQPGNDSTFRMLDPNADSIYTITLLAPVGHKEFKFFKGSGWDGGEWAGGANRVVELSGSAIVNAIWGQLGFVATRQLPMADQIKMYPNPVRDELTINATANVSKIIITNTLGKVVGNMVYSNNKTINTSNFSRGMYFVTFINADGTKSTQKLIKD